MGGAGRVEAAAAVVHLAEGVHAALFVGVTDEVARAVAGGEGPSAVSATSAASVEMPAVARFKTRLPAAGADPDGDEVVPRVPAHEKKPGHARRRQRRADRQRADRDVEARAGRRPVALVRASSSRAFSASPRALSAATK